MGQVNVIPQVYKNNFVKAVLDNSGNIDHLTCAAGDVGVIGGVNAPKIYPIGGLPYPWDVPVGTIAQVSPTGLLGAFPTKTPISFINNGEIWVPYGEQILYSCYGSYGNNPGAVQRLTLASGENIFFPGNTLFKVHKEFLYLGAGIRIRFEGSKPDADAAKTYFRLRIGNSLAETNNTQVMQVDTGAAALSHVPADVTMRITKLGIAGQATLTSMGTSKLFTPNTMALDGAGTLAVNYATSIDNYIVLSTVGTVGSISELNNFSISLVP